MILTADELIFHKISYDHHVLSDKPQVKLMTKSRFIIKSDFFFFKTKFLKIIYGSSQIILTADELIFHKIFYDHHVLSDKPQVKLMTKNLGRLWLAYNIWNLSLRSVFTSHNSYLMTLHSPNGSIE